MVFNISVLAVWTFMPWFTGLTGVQRACLLSPPQDQRRTGREWVGSHYTMPIMWPTKWLQKKHAKKFPLSLQKSLQKSMHGRTHVAVKSLWWQGIVGTAIWVDQHRTHLSWITLPHLNFWKKQSIFTPLGSGVGNYPKWKGETSCA